jgi:hypothetical protein
MPKKYYPKLFDEVHDMNVYLARYNALILAALTLVNPAALVQYEALRAAVVAFDALRESIDPLLPDDPEAVA